MSCLLQLTWPTKGRGRWTLDVSGPIIIMASSPSLWYGNYKGAVYPIDLHAAPTDLGARVRHVKTLVELCAEKIVQDSDMTRHAISIIPKPLCEPLMKVGGEEQSVLCTWLYFWLLACSKSNKANTVRHGFCTLCFLLDPTFGIHFHKTSTTIC